MILNKYITSIMKYIFMLNLFEDINAKSNFKKIVLFL